MDYDDDFFNGYESDPAGSGSGFDLSNEQVGVKRILIHSICVTLRALIFSLATMFKMNWQIPKNGS